VNLYWEVQNLGVADRAIAKSRAAQQRTTVLQLMHLQDRVASEVVRAEKQRIAADRQTPPRPGRSPDDCVDPPGAVDAASPKVWSGP
jgi:hypothetical protein